MKITGLIVSSYGRQFVVEVDGKSYQAVTKSKKTEYVVGDMVYIDLINQKQAQITALQERKNLVYRSDQNRSKIIASNIDQILIVIASKPNCNINFLNNCLIFAESAGILPIIVLNKIDLPSSAGLVDKIDSLYKNKLGYSVVLISAHNNVSNLTSLLKSKISLLLGQSGVGKSTIINHLMPLSFARTGNITKSENSGCHTTTNAQLYHMGDGSSIIDCPGLQEFGLYHLNVDMISHYFPELNQYIGKCRFRNCRHLNEPECVVNQLYISGEFDKLRFELLQTITVMLQNKTPY